MHSNHFIPTVSNAEHVQSTIAAVVKEFGKLDVFVANAGMAISKPILEQTLPEYEKQMLVNGSSGSPLSSHSITSTDPTNP
jgi:NAD(P)-dependent dehydrogenase (short-subunit alcohol dehydrogenase family)